MQMATLSPGRRPIARTALAIVALLAGIATVRPSRATSMETMFRDSFDTLGPLAGYEPSDPYEIKRGDWEVVDLPDALGGRRVLKQKSRTTTPNEPMVFVRAASFRTLAVQVTAALIDNQTNSSLGIVFRAPVLEDQSADADNLYVFTATNTGFQGTYTTGNAFTLWKRVGQGYYRLLGREVNTWADLTRAHDYKVVMAGGTIQAFVDGRLVIQHTDIPSPDQPTGGDPFPGLPFDRGAVGLRTSGASAWFDDLIVVADDAYEGRAAAVEGHLEYGVGGQTRRGTALTLSRELRNLGASRLDTGFVYKDGPFDVAAQRELGSPAGGMGTEIRTVAADGAVTSRVRLNGFTHTYLDPENMVAVVVDAATIEATARATCDATSSSARLAGATITVHILNGDETPDTTIGPIPLETTYGPNTPVLSRPGLFSITANARRATNEPRRVEVSALRISFAQGETYIEDVYVAGNRVLPRTSLGSLPVADVQIGHAVAGRYCSPRPESQD